MWAPGRKCKEITASWGKGEREKHREVKRVDVWNKAEVGLGRLLLCLAGKPLPTAVALLDVLCSVELNLLLLFLFPGEPRYQGAERRERRQRPCCELRHKIHP